MKCQSYTEDNVKHAVGTSRRVRDSMVAETVLVSKSRSRTLLSVLDLRLMQQFMEAILSASEQYLIFLPQRP